MRWSLSLAYSGDPFMLYHFSVSCSPFGTIEWFKLGIEPIANAIRYSQLHQDVLQSLQCAVPTSNWHKMFSQHCCDSIMLCLQIPKKQVVLNNDKTLQCDNALQHYAALWKWRASIMQCLQVPNTKCFSKLLWWSNVIMLPRHYFCMRALW